MKECWKIENTAGETASLYFYGPISDETWYGDEVTPRKFADELRDLGGKDLLIRLNSPGGDVFAGQALHNLIRDYPGKVTVKIDGLAASAAMLIVCAADHVIMPNNALLMVHNPAIGLCGFYTAGDLAQYASRLSAVKQSIVGAYRRKVSLEEKELFQMMDAETWMQAAEAKEKGFADEIEDSGTETAKIENNMLIINSVSASLSQYKNIDGLKRAMKGEQTTMNETNESFLKQFVNALGLKQAEQPVDAPAPTQNKEGFKQAVNEAVQKEIGRISALEALKNGNPTVEKMINLAKQNKQTAEEIKPYIEIISNTAKEEPKNKGIENITKIILENMNSGAENILPGGKVAEGDKEEEIRMTNALAKMINQKNGRDSYGEAQ